MTTPVVLLALHPDRTEAAEVASELVAWLEAQGYCVAMDADAAAGVGLERLAATDDVLAGAGVLAVCLGGDGTMLATFERVVGYGVPVLGIHLAKKLSQLRLLGRDVNRATGSVFAKQGTRGPSEDLYLINIE